jgi:hypothetical protein
MAIDSAPSLKVNHMIPSWTISLYVLHLIQLKYSHSSLCRLRRRHDYNPPQNCSPRIVCISSEQDALVAAHTEQHPLQQLQQQPQHGGTNQSVSPSSAFPSNIASQSNGNNFSFAQRGNTNAARRHPMRVQGEESRETGTELLERWAIGVIGHVMRLSFN